MNAAEIANRVVIGGGVIGPAVAAEISRHYDDVFLLEAAPRLGMGTSTRNSGVIHAGIYYKPGSLKAFHCVRGARMLYEFCAAHNVPHERTGKLVVADSEDHLPILQDLKRRGDENGVEGLEIVDGEFIRRLEPNIGSPVAINSPNTGIVEAEALIRMLERIAKSNGAHILTNTRMIGAEAGDGLTLIRTEREEFGARAVINCAGLYSDEVARMFGYDKHTIYPCRGEYAELLPGARKLVNGLVYPLPLPTGHGLGVHFTRTTAGGLLIGPNARYVKNKDDYENDRTDLRDFYESAAQMAPALRFEDMRPGYTGIRPRLAAEHEHSFVDFVIEHDPNHPSIIHLIGIESPGLTGCLSISRSVVEMAQSIL
ncbi:MAG TPA: NAD(P)/FAD-dependent oxidoreductase [Blastocatellia bacterium]|nr:NAD(P)/FAD-dependent oxidoreductase [Blastocatellia bacterium]